MFFTQLQQSQRGPRLARRLWCVCGFGCVYAWIIWQSVFECGMNKFFGSFRFPPLARPLCAWQHWHLGQRDLWLYCSLQEFGPTLCAYLCPTLLSPGARPRLVSHVITIITIIIIIYTIIPMINFIEFYSTRNLRRRVASTCARGRFVSFVRWFVFLFRCGPTSPPCLFGSTQTVSRSPTRGRTNIATLSRSRCL